MASKLIGNWGRVKKMCNNLDKDLVKSSKTKFQNEANEIASSITASIRTNQVEGEALKYSTIKAKGSSTKLLETGELASSVSVTPVSDTEYIVAPQGTHSSGLSNQDLAIIHEYGTATIPPRPFIQPQHAQHKELLNKEMLDLVAKEISKY